MSKEKGEKASRLLDQVLAGLGFTKKIQKNNIDTNEQYAVDSGPINSHILVHVRTRLVAIDLFKKMFDTYGISVTVGTGSSFTVGVSYLNKIEPSITKIIGPVEEKPADNQNSGALKPVKLPTSTEVRQDLKKNGFTITNENMNGEFWCLFFETSDIARSVFAYLNVAPSVFADKIIFKDGLTSVNIPKSQVSFRNRKVGVLKSSKATDKKRTEKAKSGDLDSFKKELIEELTKTGSEIALRFVIGKTSEFESQYEAKHKKVYHSIPKSKKEVKIPQKFLGNKIPMDGKDITISMDMIIKYLMSDK